MFGIRREFVHEFTCLQIIRLENIDYNTKKYIKNWGRFAKFAGTAAWHIYSTNNILIKSYICVSLPTKVS